MMTMIMIIINISSSIRLWTPNLKQYPRGYKHKAYHYLYTLTCLTSLNVGLILKFTII